MNKYINYIAIAFISLSTYGCKKSDFLNANPNQSLVVPGTLADYQAILDYDLNMNGTGSQGLVPTMEETGADNYFVLDAQYNSKLSPLYQNYYVWAKQIYTGDPVFDWNIPYRCIFYSNVVLDGLPKLKINKDERLTYNNVLGSALFYRAFCFYHLAQVFAPPYDKNTASKDWGIPLRLISDVSEHLQRATVLQTYEQIISDLIKAESLLPITPLYKTRPSKPAVFALLARTYQTMGDYDNALLYADSCLNLLDSLIDYNKLDSTKLFSIPRFNDEVIFHSCMQSTGYPLVPIYPFGIAEVDTILYNSYAPDDLRRIMFFRNIAGTQYHRFQGSYDGYVNFFSGLATDEIYLVRAECYARKGNIRGAMTDLNDLLIKRWKSGTFIPYIAVDAEDALRQILIERRKELCFRGLRWTDLRRLNKDPRFAITLTRLVNGQVYTLPPNDLRYINPIPTQVISFNPTMPQTPR